MALVTGIVTVLVALLSWQAFAIARNYSKARRIGLPLLICPIDPLSTTWAILGPFLNPILVRLPFGLGDFTNYTNLGWCYSDRNRLHRKLGPAFVIVTPRRPQIILGDGLAIEDVLSRRKDYVKPLDMYGVLDLFGRNLDTVNGDDWARHRKITSTPFNERNVRCSSNTSFQT